MTNKYEGTDPVKEVLLMLSDCKLTSSVSQESGLVMAWLEPTSIAFSCLHAVREAGRVPVSLFPETRSETSPVNTLSEEGKVPLNVLDGNSIRVRLVNADSCAGNVPVSPAHL